MAKMIKVAVVGGTGYTGVELLRLLVRHPEVDLTMVTSRSEAGVAVADMFQNLRGHIDLEFTPPDIKLLALADVVFFATPNGTAMKMAGALLDAGVKVIDLAADFRLRDVEQWQQWYGMTHAAPELLQQAVYGLPEMNREKIKKAQLVANPGCYPTAVQLGLLPLLELGLVSTENLIADVKSGVSGAGRKASVGALAAEVSESFQAYAVPGHRHLPEIIQGLEQVSDERIGLTFVPHLIPMIRGIHATLYARLNDAEVDLQQIFERRYAAEPFVDVLPIGSHPATRSVRGVNVCRLAVHRPQNGKQIVILSVIDNLVKGAAGQALQNMNIMCGMHEQAGLQEVALLP